MLIYRYEPPELARIDSLKENLLWFSLPSKFNDPLDCRLSIIDKSYHSIFSIDSIKEAAKILYDKPTKSYSSWLLDDEIVKCIKNWMDGIDISPDKPFFLRLIEKKIQSFGIQCFSENISHPLMWSHYAKIHSGFCVEYDYSPHTLAKNHGFAMWPAIYTSRLPQFQLTEFIFTPLEITAKVCTTKSEHWAYERERRLIYFPCNPQPGKSGALVATPNGLKVKSIIMGVNTQKEIANRLEEAANLLDVPLDRMTMDEYDYALKRVSN